MRAPIGRGGRKNYPEQCKLRLGLNGQGQRLVRVDFEFLLREGEAVLDISSEGCLQPDGETLCSVVNQDRTMALILDECVQERARAL
jgi:hypothetical protein